MPHSKKSVSPPLLIIANPSAGASAGRTNRLKVLEWARNDLEKHGFAVQIEVEKTSADVEKRAEAAAKAGAPLVVAAGGDGTVNAVLNGLMRASGGQECATKLGILPIGTGNVFAFNLDVPKHWREACAVLREGAARRIDVGLAKPFANSKPARKSGENTSKKPQLRYFLLMAGIGFDAKVIEDTSLRLKFVLRDFAYVLRSLQNAIVHRGTQLTLSFDDGTRYSNVAWLSMVGNAASYAWAIRFTEHAQLDDGQLDVCLFPFANKMVSVQQVMQLLMGQHVERGTAQYWKCKTVRVESEPPVPVQLDGDEWGTTPLELSVLPGVLQVLAPASVEIADVKITGSQ